MTLRRAEYIDSNTIRDIIFTETLSRLFTYIVYDGDMDVLDDTYQSLMFLGPPGVGKSALQKIAALDVARYLQEIRGTEIAVKKISMRISNEDAVKIANEVIEGRVIPYVHLYLPQTKIWHLEGTPSPMDNYVTVHGIKVPVNLWRLDAYLVPLLDYTSEVKSVDKIVPAFLVLDEFNMAKREILNALFQLARSAELGRAKFSPFTIISLLGNTPETNINAARQLAAPLVDRAQNYIVSRPSVAGWLAYMNEIYGDKWAREIGAYLSLNQRDIYRQDETDPTIIQTPRGWTQIAVRIYVLKYMLGKNIIAKEKYWEHVKRILYSTLINETADEVYGFLKGLHYVNIETILENPEEITKLDKNVAAYVLVKVSSKLSRDYVFEKNKQKKEEIISKLAELIKHGYKVLGVETLSLIMTALPAPMRISLAEKVPREIIGLASETRKLAEELEQVITQ